MKSKIRTTEFTLDHPLLIALVANAALLLASMSTAFGEPPPGNRHALLVGCTVYWNLAKNYHLIGPGNDVLLAKKLLVERFNFPEQNVTILADSVGRPDRAPTRANIEHQWRRLAQVAQPGDQIFVLMAGHGAQSPQPKSDRDNRETDGLDEIFLPRDVGKWNEAIGSVENAIRDDDLREWIGAITAKGASLWIVIDACHSGTMSRGASGEIKRELRPQVLGVPEEAIKKADAIAASRGAANHESETRLFGSDQKTRGGPGTAGSTDPAAAVFVALYASQSIEPTVEKKLPIGATDRKYYGLLTYTLSEVLSQTKSSMTYRELVAEIHRRYVKMDRVSPTPVLEGTAIDREVLGLESFPERSRITLSRDAVRGGWRINAGALSGMSKGSILALFPPAGEANADQVLGHVLVLDDGLRALDAAVAPCAHDQLPAPAGLETGMRCETAFVDFGDQRLKIGVDRMNEAGESITTDQWWEVARPLSQFVKKNEHLVQIVISDEADWLLRFDDAESKRLYLVPAAGFAGQGKDGKLPPLYGPAPSGGALDAWLDKSLTRIARARTLLRVAAQGIEDREHLAIEIVRYGDAADVDGQLVEFGRGKVQLFDGDEIGWKLKNDGPEPLDVTILLIDSGYGIHPLFPTEGDTNRLFPGDQVVERGVVDATTVGQEYFVVMAVKGEPLDQPVNFAYLAQPTLQRARAISKGAVSPLGDLLTAAMFGGQAAKTRGNAPAVAGNHYLFTRAWTTLPRKRPQ